MKIERSGKLTGISEVFGGKAEATIYAIALKPQRVEAMAGLGRIWQVHLWCQIHQQANQK